MWLAKADVVVVAVRSAPSPDLDLADVGGYKSLIEIAGRPAVSYVVENLRACDQVSRIVLVSNEDTREAAGEVDEFAEATGDQSEAVAAAVRALRDSPRCLVLTGDMPLACAEGISDLLNCIPDADLVYPVVGKEDVDEVYPGRKPYYVTTKEGKFTGSSLLVLRPSAVLSRGDLIVKLLNARKNPASLLGLVGAGFALRMMISTLALSEFQNSLSTGLGIDCRLFISHYPELFVSIESELDIRLMERELGG